MTKADLQAAIFAGNDVAMQWYALLHQQPLPGAGNMTVTTSGDGRANVQIGGGVILLIGLGLIGAIILLKD